MENKKWIDARFGDKWTEHALEHYTPNTICGIAIKQGRRAITLENALKAILEKCPDNPNVPYTIEIRKTIKDVLEIKEDEKSEQVITGKPPYRCPSDGDGECIYPKCDCQWTMDKGEFVKIPKA